MPFVIPYFIPHLGCPHQCLFCNQHAITGKKLSPKDLHKEINETITEWLGYRKSSVETHFAFYGGSFSCLAEEMQMAMLEAVQPWLKKKTIQTIRLSTRPDCIDGRRCRLLKKFGVGVVELGVQSLDDNVLAAAQRGHSEEQCALAVHFLNEARIQVGIQLMPGLPGESRVSFMRTVKSTIELGPFFVRIYPALVVRNSGLAKLWEKGEYRPLTLDMAVLLTAWARRMFLAAGIKVVRMGLQPSAALQKSVLAGPYHPSFGELVLSRQWLNRIRRLVAAHPGKELHLTISARDLSSFNGTGKINRKKLEKLGLEKRLVITADKEMERGRMHYVVS